MEKSRKTSPSFGGVRGGTKWSILTAAILWFVMFSPWTAPHLNFWGAMTASACVLTGLALIGLKKQNEQLFGEPGSHGDTLRLMLSTLLWGVCIAVALWWIFWIGDKVSAWMFGFAREQVNGIYAMKEGTPSWVIALLLLFLIGPAEEIFWRGYIQRNLSRLWSPNMGFLVTLLLYTAVHIPSGNFMLIMAALTCGFFWGLLYRLWPNRLPAIILSHALWDAAAFVWFPI